MNQFEIMANLERKYNLPSGYLARTRQIESAGGKNTYNANSGAAGDFQFIPRTAKEYGLKNPYDFESAADAAARLAVNNRNILAKAGIEDPSAAQLYLAHQQGAGGATKLLTAGDRPATSVVGKNAVLWNAGNEEVTGPGFAQQIMAKFEGTQLPKAAATQQASGSLGQFAKDVLGGATGGLVGTQWQGGFLGQNTVPSAMGIDTRKFGEVTEPGFSGAALPAQQEVAAAATDMGFKDYAPSMGGAAGIGSALASLGGALAKAGAAKEDMSWVQKELPAHRGKWDDEIFKRSIFGIRGLLG
ncbi:hypothetical protein UFOVP500_32 [uncultured Caudovirales phage]|uniref:Transglycosylase SLT domain-containing protein n=1 Tax=uncultured Caudovirales phage TaxID=2100421 RepID=A0A6J5MJ37_9CAUD|nr:hypothetical protein UFOVP500_32 [uncultured Caudovirales phage]